MPPETKEEYDQFCKDYAEFMEREGLSNLSRQGGEDTETFFSWRSCECCRTTLGGDRVLADGYNPTTKQVQSDYAICTDCEYFAEYGTLDDMTMLDIEA